MESGTAGGIGGTMLFEPGTFPDSRGSFREMFRSSWFDGVFGTEIQINCASSRASVLRGMHYHLRQHDLWLPTGGVMKAALLDLRRDSPTLGRSVVLELDSAEGPALLIPPGVAHGYLAVTDCTLIYVVNSYYDGSDEYGAAWDDPENLVDWGIADPILSDRDSCNPPLADAGPLAFKRDGGRKA